jgi:nitrite reductase/ring-hydroxylating ferredoxin subunit/uncharacterized membrane protein
MKSRASIAGHPLHPMLIVYPFAFLTGAFGFSVAAALTRRRELERVSQQLIPAGIATGLAAAVPGLIDYAGSVPPDSSAHTRATRHALLNTSALGLFAASWWFGGRRRTRPLALGLQGLGSMCLSVAGHMGGTLVYRNQIGVDHRYAGAGKWNESSVAEGTPESLADAGAGLERDQMKLVHVRGTRVVVTRTDSGLAAFADRCTHKGGPLSDGVSICGTVQCPWHGSQFDVHDGSVKCGPAVDPIETYPVAPRRIEGAGGEPPAS